MNKSVRLRELLALSMLAALMFGLKMALSFLPNIEPVSLLVIVYTLTFGLRALYAVYVYVGLELMVWGLGPWNINYLYIWSVLVLLTFLLRGMESRLGWALLSGAFGLGFGLLCLPSFIITGGWAYAISSWISGIPFDIAHCAGNFTLCLILQPTLTDTLKRLHRQYIQN